MVPIVFINCSSAPYISDILNGLKLYETRSSNTLRAVIGQRVMLAETGHGAPIVRASAVICAPFIVYDSLTWDNYRGETCVPVGSKHDWNDDTKHKYLYRLKDVKPCGPFTVPAGGVRHGRVWTEYEPEPAKSMLYVESDRNEEPTRCVIESSVRIPDGPEVVAS